MKLHPFTAVLLAAPSLLLSPPAHAASGYDACTGFIASVPTTISTQGVWCLDKDLGTAVASGNAITVLANNVTIDCNGFKLGGLQAGAGTGTIGIYANGRSNVTVRDCNIRGFLSGISLEGSSGGGHRIERNRFEGNTDVGLLVVGDGSLVRDNLVVDTGGTTLAIPTSVVGIAISGQVDVIDNQITGVLGGTPEGGDAFGVLASEAFGATIQRNRITTVLAEGEGFAAGVAILDGSPMDIRDNTFANPTPANSVACGSEAQVLHGNALMMGVPTNFCTDGGDNYGFTIIVPPPPD